MNISSGSPAYPLADSSCEIDYDSRSPSVDFNRQSTPVHYCFAFKNPRFSERKSYANARIPLSVNRAKLNIPYKSELCRLFQMGKCYHGENCHYSHSTSEIRRYPGLRPVSQMDHFNKGRELQECYYFSNGFDCPYGDRCEYIHKCRQKVKRDVGMNREMSAANVPSDGRYKNANNQIPCRSLASGKRDSTDVVAFRKTRLCQKWEMFGSCPYGVRCTYAHGKSELRDPSIQKDAKATEVKSNVAEKLQSKGRSYFNNWDIEKISQIYADA